MAEVIGLVASVASLIAFTSETSKACHRLAESIASFKNAQADIQKISVEILDLAQILELIEPVLQRLQEDKAGVQGHLDLVERSLARIKTGVQEIADVLVAAQSTARGSTTKTRAKWMYKKSDVASMIAIIDKQRQGLLLQFNLLNTVFAHNTHRDLKDFRKELNQVGTRIEDLTASITTSNSVSTSRFENVVQASATYPQNSIRDEMHQTGLSVPRESNIFQTSLETFSVSVSNIVASRSESLDSETSLNYPESRSCTQIDTAQRSQNEPHAEDVETVTSLSHATIDDFLMQHLGQLARGRGSLRLVSRTSVKTMRSFFGSVVIRRSTVKSVFLGSDEEISLGEIKFRIVFIPASSLQSWARYGIFLARMSFGKPAFDINFIAARNLDFGSNLDTRKALHAVETGDIRTLNGALQRKVVYPRDRNLYGFSLLSIAASSGQLEICELLLQQGAAVDINMPSSVMKVYPIEFAIRSSTKRNDHEFVRLFLKYGADIRVDPSGWSFVSHGFTMRSLVMLPIQYECAMTHETESLFRLLVDNDPSFDINRRERPSYGTPIMVARNQPLQIYEDLINLGADVQALTQSGDTVLHEFFKNMFCENDLIDSIDTFLEGGDILALLIRAGADPLAANRFGELPQDVCSRFSPFPLRRVEERIYLAFWHQAQRICGLSGSEYCHCSMQHLEKTTRPDVDPNFPSRGPGLRRLLFEEEMSAALLFEEELSAALRGWDKSAAQQSSPGSADPRIINNLDTWDERCGRYDKWIQRKLIELQARQERVASTQTASTRQPTEDESKLLQDVIKSFDDTMKDQIDCLERMYQDNLEIDEMQSSDHLSMNRSASPTRKSAMDEEWECFLHQLRRWYIRCWLVFGMAVVVLISSLRWTCGWNRILRSPLPLFLSLIWCIICLP